MTRLCDITMFWSDTGGGVRRYLERKSAWLSSSCPDMSHLLVTPGSRLERSMHGGSEHVRVPSPSLPFAPGYRVPLSTGPTRSVLRSWMPDIVESGCPFALRRAAGAWAREAGRPVFDYYHAYFPVSYTEAVFGRRTSLLRRALERAGWRYLRSAYADSARVFVASPAIRDVLALQGVTNTELAPLGVDTDVFRPSAGREGVPTVLFVGRLTREKGLETVLEAFRIMRERMPCRLVVAGDGILRRRIERLAAVDPSVAYAGFTRPGALAGLYSSASLLLSGAPAETLGLTFLEALSCDTPVVGLSGSGLMDSFPPEVATAVSRATPEALAGAALGMLEAPPAPGLCRALALEYSWPVRLARIVGREHELAGLPPPGCAS
jgi:alpha-1,6-mannosyltransferase